VKVLCFCPIFSDITKRIVLFEVYEASPACPSYRINVKIQTSMEHWWNGSDTGEQKYSVKILSQRHLKHHKSHMDWYGIEDGTSR
jgi:hypothetical protein